MSQGRGYTPAQASPGPGRGHPPRFDPRPVAQGYAPAGSGRGAGGPPGRGGFTGGRGRGVPRGDNRERMPSPGERFASEVHGEPEGGLTQMAPSKPPTAPRAGGKGFPPVATNHVELEENGYAGDEYDYEEDMAYEPEEYGEEDYGPADPEEFSENE